MAIKVLHVGLGPIGAAAARQVLSRKSMRIVGAVDLDPARIGQDLGKVVGLRRKLDVTVTDDLVRAIKTTKPDIAVLCTQSSLKKALPEFETVLKLKVPIVSSTEELSYPTKSHAPMAKRID